MAQEKDRKKPKRTPRSKGTATEEEAVRGAVQRTADGPQQE